MRKPRDSRHMFRWTALRARRRWMRSVRGRDAYAYRLGPFRYRVSYIDYEPPKGKPTLSELGERSGAWRAS